MALPERVLLQLLRLGSLSLLHLQAIVLVADRVQAPALAGRGEGVAGWALVHCCWSIFVAESHGRPSSGVDAGRFVGEDEEGAGVEDTNWNMFRGGRGFQRQLGRGRGESPGLVMRTSPLPVDNELVLVDPWHDLHDGRVRLAIDLPVSEAGVSR